MVLPRYPHGDEGPDVCRAPRRFERRLRQYGLRQERHVSFLLRILPAAMFAAGASGFAGAETLKAAPDQPLQAVLDRAQAGDVIELAPGDYKGAIRIDRHVVLTGRPGGVLDGGGAGNVVTVTAPDVTIRGVTIRGSGRDLQTMDLGVFLEKSAQRALIENNRFEENLFGIYVHGAAGSRVLRNVVEGIRDGRLSEAGNGVSLWNAPMSPSPRILSATAATASSRFPAARIASSTIASIRCGLRSITCTPTTAK